MDFKKVSLAFLGAMAAGALFAACDGLDNATLYNACTGDLSCSAGEICHPTAGVCVQTCDTADTCPSESKTCAAISATNATKVCQCSTTALCQGVDAALSCDAAASVCSSGGSNTDAGTDAGTECTIGTCGSGEVCNNGTCQTAAACSGTGQSTCAYGQFCKDGATCADVEAAPTCSNFTSAGSPDVNFTSSSTGPVIFSVRQVADNQGKSGISAENFCGAGMPIVTAEVKAYRTDRDWQSTITAESGFFYVLVDGEKKEVIGKMVRATSGYDPQGKIATFFVNFCPAAGISNLQAGLYFTNGNAVCNDFSI